MPILNCGDGKGTGSLPAMKTINNESIIGEGNISVQPVGDYATQNDISTVNGEITLANQRITNLGTSKQDTLESGVNIKAINGQSLLGSGNINITATSELIKCYTGSSSSPNYNITLDTMPGAIRNSTGVRDGVFIVAMMISESLIANESIYGVWGIYDSDGMSTVNVLGIADDYNASKNTYVIIGGRVGKSGGTVPGEVNKIAVLNTINNTISIITMPSTFKVYAVPIALGTVL